MHESTIIIIQGTCAASAASAFVTGVHGIVKGEPRYPLLALAAGINTGITVGTFFGIREYAVSPLLIRVSPGVQYARRRQMLGIGTGAEELPPLSRSELRTERLLDSGISGIITGGLLQVLRNNLRAAPGSAFTGLFFCTILQYGYNEIGIMRSKEGPVPAPSNTSKSLTNGLLAALGVRELDNQEHIKRLTTQRNKHLRRIAELERQIAEDKSNLDDA